MQMLSIGSRPIAVAVATQVSGDHGEFRRQLLGDLVPDDVGLRVAVQQQQRRATAADAIADGEAIDLALLFLETSEHDSTP